MGIRARWLREAKSLQASLAEVDPKAADSVRRSIIPDPLSRAQKKRDRRKAGQGGAIQIEHAQKKAVKQGFGEDSKVPGKAPEPVYPSDDLIRKIGHPETADTDEPPAPISVGEEARRLRLERTMARMQS